MNDRGYFSGASMHQEFHTVNRKKVKASDCIYLSEDRICYHESSPNYTSKCFDASWCQLRVTGKGEKINLVRAKKQLLREGKKANTIVRRYTVCSLPKGCSLRNKMHGEGSYVSFNYEKQSIKIQFADKQLEFSYPDAIIQKNLSVSNEIFKVALKDKEASTPYKKPYLQ